MKKIQRLDCFKNQLASLPKLPDGLKGFYRSHNKFTFLPKLPDGLEELYCVGDRFTSLPRLPVALKVLSYSYNPLSQKTVQKIKSHPNYNSNWEMP